MVEKKVPPSGKLTGEILVLLKDKRINQCIEALMMAVTQISVGCETWTLAQMEICRSFLIQRIFKDQKAQVESLRKVDFGNYIG